MRLWLLHRVWTHIPTALLESQQALHAYRGGDMLDVGAFHGWYTVLLAPKSNPGDRFVSCEPDPGAVPMLREVLGDLARHFPSVSSSVITQPVGDGQAVAASWPPESFSHPRYAQTDDAGSVPSLRIDDVVSDQRLCPTLIKVDVEGAELAVLNGMRETLAKYRPALMLEIHPAWQPDGATAGHVEEFVREVGYDGTTLEDSPLARRQFWWPRTASVVT